MKKVLKISGIILGVIVLLLIGGLVYFNSTFPKVSPPPNIIVESTPEKIERGRYLANNVSMCMDCHSERNWMLFSAPPVPGTEGRGGDIFDKNMGFPGTIHVKNITPAAIGDWTDGEIARAITMGLNKKGEALFPVMPYFNLNKLTQEDLESIIAYIRTLKPIENEVPDKELDFPLNFIVKTLPLQTYTPSEPVDKSNTVLYGKYLVTIASCGDCHTQSVEGEPVAGMEFAGGTEMKLPGGTLRSANITPDMETGIGKWTKEMFINKFKSFASDSARNIPADITKEFNSIMPWVLYSGITEEDLGAIYDYLRTLTPVENKVEKFTPARSQFANVKR